MKYKLPTLTIFVLAILILMTGCSLKPVNLSTARDEVKAYYESGKYDEELSNVVSDAKEKFNGVDVKDNSVVIFDVDETVLNNYESAKQMGFGFVYNMVKDWNEKAEAPAIPYVKDLYDFLLSKGFKIIFLTGRNFPEYDATYKNLKQAGYAEFDTLITQREHEYKLKAVEFKSSKRVELTKKGHYIVGTVGDQWSDLEGEYHGIQVKIPNYLYLIED
jgi:acid phosphatase